MAAKKHFCLGVFKVAVSGRPTTIYVMDYLESLSTQMCLWKTWKKMKK